MAGSEWRIANSRWWIAGVEIRGRRSEVRGIGDETKFSQRFGRV